jgi:hypothetical protein
MAQIRREDLHDEKYTIDLITVKSKASELPEQNVLDLSFVTFKSWKSIFAEAHHGYSEKNRKCQRLIELRISMPLVSSEFQIMSGK